MSSIELLEKIKADWLSRVSQRLAQGEILRERFLEEAAHFYDCLLQAVERGNPGLLDSTLEGWVVAQPQSELNQEEASLAPVLGSLLEVTQEVLSEQADPAAGWEVWGKLLPVYTHAFEHLARCENQQQIERISAGLEKSGEELKRLDKSKSDFIAVAAHELKTPLTLIEGYTSMLREILPDDTETAFTTTYLNGIDRGSHRLREIVDDMIDVSMIDNNLLSIHFQPMWINRLLGVVMKEMKEAVKQRRQTLELRPFPGSDELTYGDGERLLQAFRNLITNAVKFTPDGGRIIIDGRLLPGFIEVTIADSGIGIDPEDYGRIFEKFGRLGNVALHSSSKTRFKGGGPGLGLAISKGIIEAHGGAIWVESKGYDEAKMPGSTFHVLLPILKEPPDDKSAKLFQVGAGGL